MNLSKFWFNYVKEFVLAGFLVLFYAIAQLMYACRILWQNLDFLLFFLCMHIFGRFLFSLIDFILEFAFQFRHMLCNSFVFLRQFDQIFLIFLG